MTLEEYFGDWVKVIDIPLLNKTVNTLNYLYSKKSIMPEYSNIFKAFTLTSLSNLKVVFIGQDPYPQKMWQQVCYLEINVYLCPPLWK